MTKVSKNGLSTVTWYQNEKCSILIRDVKIIFSDIRFLKPKIPFFYYRLSADSRNWFRQVSSTDDESGCASSTR